MNLNNLDKKKLTWKPNYPGSVVLCNQNSGAVNAIVVGQFLSGSLDTAVSDRGYQAPGYRLTINIDAGTIATLQKILKSGPFEDEDIYSPLKNGAATFSVKFKALKQEEKKGKGGKEKDGKRKRERQGGKGKR